MTKKPCQGVMIQTLKLDDPRFSLKPYLYTCPTCNKLTNLSEEDLGGSLVCSETYKVPEEGEVRFYPGDDNLPQYRHWVKMVADSARLKLKMDPEWRDFQNFYLWTEACEDFDEELDLTLKVKSEGYYPHNCVWWTY